MQNQKRVYLSCVTKELHTLRGEIAEIFSTSGGQAVAFGDFGIPGLAAAEGLTFGKKIRLRPGGAVDLTIDATTAKVGWSWRR